MAKKLTDNKSFPTSGTSNNSISPFYKAPKYFNIGDDFLHKKKYSGSPTNNSGLVEFTGEYPKKSPYPLVTREDTKSKFEEALRDARVALQGASSDPNADYSRWSPTIAKTTVPTNFGTRSANEADLSDNPHPGAEVGRVISMDIGNKESDAKDYKILDQIMARKGFVKLDKNGNTTKEVTGTWEYRGDLKNKNTTPDYVAEKAALSDDLYLYNTNIKKAHANRENRPSRYEPKGISATESTLEAVEEVPVPAKFVSDSGVTKTSAPVKQQQLEVAKTKQAVSKLKVVQAPSNRQTNIDSAEQDLIRSETGTLKTIKNVYTDSDVTKCPLGLEEKLDMPAQIRIYLDKKDQPKSIEMESFESSTVGAIDCFLLRSVQARQEERYFVFQSLYGDITTFFFGEKPTIYAMSGVLLDSYNQQWLNDFEFFYNNYLRGSKSILNNSRIYMVYDDQIIEGYILNMQFNKTGDFVSTANFNFDMILIQKTHMKGYINPVERNKIDPESSSIASFLNHATRLLSGNIGASIVAAADTWVTDAESLTTPVFNILDTLTSIPASQIASEQKAIPEEGKSGDQLRAEIGEAAQNPGGINGQSIRVRNFDELSSREKNILANTPSIRQETPII